MVYPFSSPNGYEERLNRQFAGYLYYSLQVSPELAEVIHSDQEITFSDDAKMVAHQYSPLSQNTEDGTDREIDWVIGSESRLVGYESKYGDTLTERQLRDELDKLRLNAEGRDVALVAVTHHKTRPSVVERLEDEPVHWLSWYTVSRRVNQKQEDEVSPEQRPILRMLQDLFNSEDMTPFTGFDHHDKQQYRYFIRDLRQELVGEDIENRGGVHTQTTKDVNPSSWKRIVPKRLDTPFVRESRNEDAGRLSSYLTVTVDTETHEVHAGIVFNVRSVETHQEYVSDRAEELVEYADSRNLKLWASRNSFNHWEVGVPETRDPDEMYDWLTSGASDDIMVDGTQFKKAVFVEECPASEPPELIQQTKNELLEFNEDFLVSDDLYPWKTLEEK
jgi:hypothetical protein